MKKLMVVLMMALFVSTTTAQTKFFGKVQLSPTVARDDGKMVGEWFPRPTFSFTALQVPFGGQPRFMNAVGTGVGYGLFKPGVDGKPYQTFAVNLMFLLGTPDPLMTTTAADNNDTPTTEMTIGLGVVAWQYVNIGVGYNFGLKNGVVFLNAVYSFN